MKSWNTSSGGGPERFKSTLWGILIGAGVVCLIWLIAIGTSQGSGDSQTTGTTASDSPNRAWLADHRASVGRSQAAGGNNKQALRRAVLSSCQEVYASQADPLHAAAEAMGQWQTHIAAMNQLVLGVISLDQANQFWSQTRTGARTKLHAFKAADARLRQPSSLCPAPPAADPSAPRSSSPASTNEKVLGCERAVAARFQVLRSARVALGTWGMHVMHMDMLRNGQMTPQRAEALWLHSWHEGQQEVTSYQAAMHATRGMRC